MVVPLPSGSCLSIVALSLLAARAAGGVIRIAEQPALGPFTTLQAAVNAAPEGALLLVEAGSYGEATIDGKSLSIVAMPTSGAKAGAALTITNLAAHQVVLLSGMSFSSTSTPGVTLTGNTGHVRIQGCTIAGGKAGGFDVPAHAGILAVDCLKVVVSGCTLYGGSPGYLSGESPVAGGHGLQSSNSAVALFDSTLTGGTGSEEGAPMGGEGGDGCNVTGWGIFASGCTFKGGHGGGGDYIGCTTGGSGGDGLHITGAQAVLLDVATQAGNPGWSPCNQYGGGASAIENNGGVVTQLPGTRRKLTGAALASDAASLTLTLTGQPGDRLFLLTGFAPAYVFMPGLGVWTVRRPVHVPATPLGIVGPNGTLTVVVPTAHLAAGKAHGQAFLQGVVHDASDQGFLTSALQVELLDRDGGPDCNANQVNDFVDLLELTALDCNKNLLPDACDIASGFAQDCNLNTVPDACEIASGAQKDCNANGVPDACDLVSGVSQDCNGNGKPDSCDIAGGASLDVNGNGIPDECEIHVPVTWWVDPAAPAGGNGSQASPFQTISQVIVAAFHGDTVMLADGVYTGPANRNLSTAGREIVIRSQAGSANCIIDCQGAGRAFRIDDGEGPNCKLVGLTIRNGNASMSPTDPSQGGGIYVRTASPTIEDCVIEACSGRMGGGIYASVTSLQLRGSKIQGCVAPFIGGVLGLGGGAYVSWVGYGGQQAAFVDTVFSGCSANVGGGLAYGSDNNAPNPALILSHCTFIDNTAGATGGALLAEKYSNGGSRVLLMENCLVAGNSALEGAGAALTATGFGTNPGWTFSSCTFAHNTSTIEGGALWLASTSSLSLPPIEIQDSILWANTAPVGVGMFQSGPGTVEVRVSSSDVEFGSGSFDLKPGSTLVYDATNLELDPFFADEDGPDNDPNTAGDNDYRLAAGSPCADAGDNGLVAQDLIDIDGDGNTTEPAPLDLAKSPRFVDDPLAPDTGQGTAPLVDIGAYERP
jgi:hypothetical protein